MRVLKEKMSVFELHVIIIIGFHRVFISLLAGYQTRLTVVKKKKRLLNLTEHKTARQMEALPLALAKLVTVSFCQFHNAFI